MNEILLVLAKGNAHSSTEKRSTSRTDFIIFATAVRAKALCHNIIEIDTALLE